ncbi:MAG: hypothetical protein JST81_11590 [Bacteroidetes bacterium]|nr:hypothetical protein [Bacteroidota bacterium]
MKKVISIASAFIFICSINNESVAATTATPTTISVLKADVPPAVVVNSFRNIFGNVPVKQWKLRSNGQWRAHFLRNGIAWEATFTSTGILVKSERA